MRRLGRVLHISPNKKAVIKAEKIPKIGETVVDNERRRVGTVFDVFGPTVSPYVEVEIKLKDPEKLINRLLFVSSAPKHRVRSRRRK